jgi:sulfhydrogenase subunit delta
MSSKPRVAFYKFSSCSGCQQSMLNAEKQLVDVLNAIDFVYWIEAKRENLPGPYDLAIVEGSISTPHEVEMVKELREQAKVVIPIGACAVYGGPQALRNWADPEYLKKVSYEHPEYLDNLDTTTGIDSYIPVDYKVYGCGPNPAQLVEVVTDFLQGRTPNLPQHSVCVQCKLGGNVCLLVAGQQNCMGPVTVAGCGAACPSHKRGCYGCFGPMSAPNGMALAKRFEMFGNSSDDIVRMFRNQNSNAPKFKEVALAYAQKRRMAA